MSSPAAVGHNFPPVAAPADEDMLADLQRRYPDLAKEQAEFEAALKTYPKELTLEDAEAAAALQDVLGKMKRHKTRIGADKKSEKKPWAGIVNVVINFFDKAEEKIETLYGEWQPRHQAYMDLVKAEALRKANEEAEKQRAAQAAAEKAAREAEDRAEAARQEEAAARAREDKARADAAAAEEEKRQAQARAEAAKAEEDRLAREKKERDRDERERNENGLRDVRRYMREAEKLHTTAEADEATDADVEKLDGLIKPGGVISTFAGPVRNSMLLDEAQTAELKSASERLAVMRAAMNTRFDAKEKRRRAAETKKAEEAEAVAAAKRKAIRDAEEAEAAKAKAAREKADAERETALAAEKAARSEVKEALADQRGAVAEQKSAGKEIRQAGIEAERAGNRADRIEYKLENASDAEIAGTLRGDLGTKGSLTRRWTLRIADEEALRAACGPLGATFTQDALNGAAYRWMLARISGWSGRERVDGNDAGLPGVVFAYQQGSRIA